MAPQKKCDRCGTVHKLICSSFEPKGPITVEWLEPALEFGTPERYDLCYGCADEFRKWFNEWIRQANA